MHNFKFSKKEITYFSLLLFISVLSILAVDEVILTHAWHDIFVPINAAYKFENLVFSHFDYKTPVGIIYQLIHGVSSIFSSDPVFIYRANILYFVVFSVTVFFLFSGEKKHAYIVMLICLIPVISPKAFIHLSTTLTFLASYNKWTLINGFAILYFALYSTRQNSIKCSEFVAFSILIIVQFYIKAFPAFVYVVIYAIYNFGHVVKYTKGIGLLSLVILLNPLTFQYLSDMLYFANISNIDNDLEIAATTYYMLPWIISVVIISIFDKKYAVKHIITIALIGLSYYGTHDKTAFIIMALPLFLLLGKEKNRMSVIISRILSGIVLVFFCWFQYIPHIQSFIHLRELAEKKDHIAICAFNHEFCNIKISGLAVQAPKNRPSPKELKYKFFDETNLYNNIHKNLSPLVDKNIMISYAGFANPVSYFTQTKPDNGFLWYDQKKYYSQKSDNIGNSFYSSDLIIAPLLPTFYDTESLLIRKLRKRIKEDQLPYYQDKGVIYICLTQKTKHLCNKNKL